MTNGESDRKLIQRSLDGDANGFSLLYKRYYSRLLRFVFSGLKGYQHATFEDAEEVTNDVFVRAFRKLEGLDEPNKFRAWLYIIAKRRCIAWYRENKLPEDVSVISLCTEANEQAVEAVFAHMYDETQRDIRRDEANKQLVAQMLSKLATEAQRKAIVLFYLEGKSYEEIAQILQRSLKSIGGLLDRARKKLVSEFVNSERAKHSGSSKDSKRKKG